jgi:hypothetical protein
MIELGWSLALPKMGLLLDPSYRSYPEKYIP